MIREPTGIGTAYRRVLDLLAGWDLYVSECADGYPNDRDTYDRESSAIGALYQELGGLYGDYADLDRAAIAMLERITRLAIDGATQQASEEQEKK